MFQELSLKYSRQFNAVGDIAMDAAKRPLVPNNIGRKNYKFYKFYNTLDSRPSFSRNDISES